MVWQYFSKTKISCLCKNLVISSAFKYIKTYAIKSYFRQRALMHSAFTRACKKYSVIEHIITLSYHAWEENLLFVSHDDNINNKLIKQWNLQTTIETATTTTNDSISPFVLIIWKPLLFSETYMRHGDVQELLAIIYTYVWIMGRKYLHITVGVLRNYIFAILAGCTAAHWTYSFRRNIYSEIFLLLQ